MAKCFVKIRKIGSRSVYYASAIGTEPQLAETIIKQVASFDSRVEGSGSQS